MNLRKLALIAAAVAATTAGLAFPATQANAQISMNVLIGNEPPPPRYEPVPPPRAGYVWAPGYWAWDGHRHDWRAGHWERAHPGESYIPAGWDHGPMGWRFHPGGWGPGSRDHNDHDYGHGHDHDRGYGPYGHDRH